MTVQAFTFNPFQTNSYVIHSDGEAAIIDASSHQVVEHQKMITYIEDHELTVTRLLLTHAHIDHIFGCKYLSNHYDVDFELHPDDAFLIERSMQQSTAFAVPLERPERVITTLQGGDQIEIGSVRLSVLHTPGHSPGSVTFAGEGVAVSGDVLFQGSIGRIEGLPRTSKEQLLNSIQEKLLPLGDDVRVYPGHGPSTTIGREKRSNPFLAHF